MSEKQGQIIVVNGTSGSGKSTACENFVRKQDDFWLLYGIDHYVAGTFPAKFGHHGPRSAEGFEAIPLDPNDPEGALRWRFGPMGMAGFATFHDWAAAASRNGCNMIFDHLLMSEPPVIQDLAHRLDGVPALLVTLKPPYEVLMERVAQRQMTKKLPVEVLGEDAARKIVERLDRLRDWFYDAVYENDISDIVIDTSLHDPDDVTALIEARLAEGPGTAFKRLRQKWPKQ